LGLSGILRIDLYIFAYENIKKHTNKLGKNLSLSRKTCHLSIKWSRDYHTH